ncbi:MAG TPA: MiaB/RimO family radical SAM methylthiotransferase, partial [Gemmatimonadaceae bacterium]
MKVYLHTFGCRANHYDTEVVREMLGGAGHTIVAAAEDADVAVFNSCAVTSEAEADLRKAVRRAARDNPRLRSVVTGCAAALEEDRPAGGRISELPSVSQVIAGAGAAEIAAAFDIPARLTTLATRRQSSTRALLRVQDGCDEHCTFCATTMARGANRGRPADVLVREAQALAEHHSEIVITGIHIGSYGVDAGSSLGELLQRLVREVPSARFRLSSLEATEVDERLFELLTGAPGHVAPYLHAPLQSGSDRVLRRMGRHWYSATEYADAVERLAAVMPMLGLGADVIAGFPGETDDDHAATVALVERLPFTYLHIFPFSRRPGTPAERLGQFVSPAVIERRAAELRRIGKRKRAVYEASRAGGTADVVVIGGPDRAGAREGLTGD